GVKRAILLLAGIVVAAQPAGAQTGADGATPPDTTSTRPLISTDGSVSVYEEATPGEGIEGFWWEFNAAAELARLLDKDRREDRLDPIVDRFGFELVIPDSIRDLRDSVFAVADSILDATIETSTPFDPRISSSYTEQKDVYAWTNELETSIPMTQAGSVVVKGTVRNDFNESTKVYKNNRDLATTFNYHFDQGIATTFGVTRTGNLQERDDIRENEGTNTAVTGSVHAIRESTSWGKLETGFGASVNEQNYATAITDGRSENLTPDWNVKYNRPWGAGDVTVDYRGKRGRARRTETSRTLTGEVGGDGLPIETITTTDADERNLANNASLAANWDVNEYSKVRFIGSFSRDSFQYLSQADTLRGRQETRRQLARSTRLAYDTKPSERIDFKTSFEIRQNETNYDLETARFTRTTAKIGDVTLIYQPWHPGKFTVKLFSQEEDREYVSDQSGLVYAQKASADYEHLITANVTATAGYFVTLDSFFFDDPASNTGDRDLKREKGLFTVNYVPPVDGMTTKLTVDIRKDQTVNIHATRAGTNRDDYTYIITPEYTWKTGRASITGDFNADVRYKLFPFLSEDDELTRRFSMGQRWQHQFTGKTSTDLLWNYEFTDQGGYPLGADGHRRFARSGELRRLKLELKLLYSPLPNLKTNVRYRRDSDDVYSIRDGERDLTSEPTTKEFSFGVDFRKRITPHVSFDVVFEQSHKEGALATSIERRFYNIRASLKYRPFKVEEGG
ncbi:MAG: hypothetical protein ACRDGR_10620, partial [bacterium]